MLINLSMGTCTFLPPINMLIGIQIDIPVNSFCVMGSC